MKSMEIDTPNGSPNKYTSMSIDYSTSCQDYYPEDHDYSSLHDMIEVDANSNAESLYPQVTVSAGKGDVTSTTPGDNSVRTSLPSISSAHTTLDLDSSVSNLSWLHNLQQQVPETNGNPNLLVNPQTGTPIRSSSQSVRIVTLPSNVHISNSNGNIKYVTVPSSKQQVYISTSKSLMTAQQLSSRSNFSYQRSYNHSPGSIPSSTVPDNPFPKPAYSYSCLIALSLKNSRHGSLPVAEIYNFMMTNFPYFKTAPDGWKNSVRHNLSLNKCFEKIENPNSDGTHSRKGCLWAMNPNKIKKMDEEVAKWNKKDLIAIKRSMANPDLLDVLTRGQGAYLMEKSQSSSRQAYHTTHLSNRPGIRIVTSVQSSSHHTHSHLPSIGNGSLDRQQLFNDQIDLNKLAEDAADLFGDHGELALDPSLSDFALQSGMLDDLHSEMFDLPPLNPTTSSSYTNGPSKITSPLNSPMKNQMYNPNSILPIY